MLDFFQNVGNFRSEKGQDGQNASPCQTSRRSVKVKPLLRHGHFSILQDGGRPPSWICDERIWTIHEGDLVVFITVQKFG